MSLTPWGGILDLATNGLKVVAGWFGWVSEKQKLNNQQVIVDNLEAQRQQDARDANAAMVAEEQRKAREQK